MELLVIDCEKELLCEDKDNLLTKIILDALMLKASAGDLDAKCIAIAKVKTAISVHKVT